ncbi:MAG: DNA polymerase III subunit delta [Lachnospiraceae bacterium]|nr:DNA polymerase III subunit delta [Lachnospiraceae bacterium]
MKRINDQIKENKIYPVYFLYGEEEYLVLQAKDKLKKHLIGDENTMNYHYFQGNKIEEAEVVELMKTLPFFASVRLIVLDHTDVTKWGKDLFLTTLNQLPDTTCVIILEDTLDKRSKLFKLAQSVGFVGEFNRQAEESLTIWIKRLIGMEGKMISDAGVAELLNRVGTDMFMIKHEVEKLICFAWDKQKITEYEVKELVSDQASNQIFEMITAMANQQKEQALSLYYDLLSLKQSSLGILALIVRQYNILLQVKELKEKASNAEIAKKVGIPIFTVKKYIAQSNKYTMDLLRGMIKKCGETEEAIKTGGLDQIIGVELLIVEFSSANS